MKPLLVILPSPARWSAVEQLLAHEGSPWLEDLEARVKNGVTGATDVLAIIPNGAQVLAIALVCNCGDIGILRHVCTRADHRRRGFARQVLDTLLSWFPMSGGRRLYLTCRREEIEFLAKFGFYETHVATTDQGERIMMRRMWPGAVEEPTEFPADAVRTRALTRAEWPHMVALLQHRTGAIPNVPIEQSAVAAPANTLDLLNQQDRRACALLGGFVGTSMIGFASVATDQLGERTYAMLTPFDPSPSPLRAAAIELGQSRGYKVVDFPLEGVAHPAAVAQSAPAAD